MKTIEINKNIKKRLSSYSKRGVVDDFLDLMKKLITDLNISKDDERFSTNVRNVSRRKRISVNLNGRLVAGLRSNKPCDEFILMLYCDTATALRNDGISIVDFDTPFKGAKQLPLAALYQITPDTLKEHYDSIYRAWNACCTDYLITQVKSQYRRYHYPQLFELIQDTSYRSDVLDTIEFNTLSDGRLETPFDQSIVLKHLADYKNKIQNGLIPAEEYKWHVLKELNDRWDWNRTDKSAMLRETFLENFKSKEMNLWRSGQFFPVEMAITILDEAPETVLPPLNKLLDPSIDDNIIQKMENVINAFDQGLVERNKKVGKEDANHYHNDLRILSIYLSLNEPDTNFIYKHTVYKNLATKINSPKPKTGQVENYDSFRNLALQLRELLYKDEELIKMYTDLLDTNPSYYQDPYLQLLTQDFIYFISETSENYNVNYWKVGCKDDDGIYKDNFLNNNYAALGWNDLGDFNAEGVESRKDIIKLFKHAGYTYAKNVMSRKAGEIFDFYRNAKVGDIILMVNGQELLAIGELKGEYKYKPNEPFAHTREAVWTHNNISNVQIEDGPRTTFYPISNEITIDKIKSLMSENNSKTSSSSSSKSKAPLNQILYGPPGTGKTYATKEMAVNIIAPEFFNKKFESDIEKRSAIISKYNELHDSGQIVFTTFHQSMSYEDFVEGIKPETIDDRDVIYKTKPGIFKKLCTLADVQQGNFDEVIEKFKTEVAEDEEKKPLLIESKATSFEVIHRNGNVFLVSPVNTSKEIKPWYTVNVDYMKHYFDTGYTTGTNSTYSREIINFLANERKLVKESQNRNQEKYVLIIDEINRGNISAIFGELITLLEEDKRISLDKTKNTEELKVKLPYSGQDFGVPPNLHIIGTMNTADRSVEALDTALRRRFTFKEVMPKPELLKDILFEGFSLEDLLTIINDRIEVLLDRDHTIGHSYFIKLESGDEAGLKAVFKDNIIPLLQEYFYGDYEKIAWVLGKEFVEYRAKPDIKFPKFKGGNKPETSASFRIRNIDKNDFNIIKAIKGLINPDKEAVVADEK